VLVVAPLDETRDHFVSLLRERGDIVESAPDAISALDLVEQSAPDLAVIDLSVPDAFGLVDHLKALAPTCAVVALTEEGSVDVIVDAIKRGADHCLTRPVKQETLDVVIGRALEKPQLARSAEDQRERADERLDLGNFGTIVGDHPLIQQLLKKTFQAARSRATVLIHGETGTGKELIAAAIHQNSKRAAGPFVRLNCAALADSVLESELFGHEKGAFTGAVVRRKGRFEQAHGGTLFLDEVSEIPPAVQVKLLRFLQERELERVGGDETFAVDVRVVAATNRNLKALVDDGAFREDLFYRLNVVRLDVPPLRARPSDVPRLAEHFLRRYAEENEKEISGLSDKARDVLIAHSWPGNVRELQNVIEQAVVLCEGDVIDVSDLPLTADTTEQEPLRLMIPGVTLAELERYAIMKTLEAVGGSPTKAAKILGVSRRTIQYRMREWGLGKSRDSNK
jgi:two-component system response regulator HydG